MTTSETRVIFFQVRDNPSKLAKILETAHAYFKKKERFLILVEDEKAQQFVDELLWKSPPTSFLPHIATDDATDEWIVISKMKQNKPRAKIAFNLCSTPLLLPFRLIYDFEDLTAPNKQTLSNLRFDAYKQNHFSIEASS